MNESERRILSTRQTSSRRRARRSDEPRNERVNLRLSTTEKRIIEIAAQQQNLSAGAYAARAAVLVGKGDLLPLPVDEAEKLRALAEARVALNRIGTNLNQIAHVLNSEGVTTPEQLAAVLSRVQQVVEHVDDACLSLMDDA